MAGDWIPIEHETPRKPEVLRVAARTGASRREVVGTLVEIWSWVSANSTDGRCNASVALLSRLFDTPELFFVALEEVGWLKVDGETTVFLNADRWLTNGAKSRLQNSKRQKIYREKCRAFVAQKARPEKRREEKSKTTTPLTPLKGGTLSVSWDSVSDQLPESHRTDRMQEAWEAFVESRKSTGHKLSARAAKLNLNKIAGVDYETAVAAVELSAARGYRGIDPTWLNGSKGGEKIDTSHWKLEPLDD